MNMEIRATTLAVLATLSACGSSGEAEQASPATVRPDTGSSAAALCSVDEYAVFSCEIAGKGARASLCASADVGRDSGHMYYVYGTADRIESTFPSGRTPPIGNFSRTHLAFAGGSGGYAYSFVDSGTKHVLYSISGAMGLERQGILALDAAGNPKVALECKRGTFVEDDAEVLRTLTSTLAPDDAIAREGLPLVD